LKSFFFLKKKPQTILPLRSPCSPVCVRVDRYSYQLPGLKNFSKASRYPCAIINNAVGPSCIAWEEKWPLFGENTASSLSGLCWGHTGAAWWVVAPCWFHSSSPRASPPGSPLQDHKIQKEC